MSDTRDTAASPLRSALERGVRATPREPGLLETLLRAAYFIETDAAALRSCHTVRGRWGDDEPEAKAAYDEMRSVAARLRKAHKYMVPNPLGGPAKVFDACADSIRAGEPIDAAMANFGLAWVRSNARIQPPAPGGSALE